jgi:hypothetical protein
MLRILLFILQNIQQVPVRFEASSGRQNVREYNYIYKHIIDSYICVSLYKKYSSRI